LHHELQLQSESQSQLEFRIRAIDLQHLPGALEDRLAGGGRQCPCGQGTPPGHPECAGPAEHHPGGDHLSPSPGHLLLVRVHDAQPDGFMANGGCPAASLPSGFGGQSGARKEEG